MPRRPRPASRRAPKDLPHSSRNARADPTTVTSVKVKPPKGKPSVGSNDFQARKRPVASSSDSGEGDDTSEDSEDVDGGNETEDSEQEDVDVDAPRVSQWVDEDEFDSQAWSTQSGAETEEDEDEEEVSDFEEGSSTGLNMRSLQNDLSSLPFGTLRKAQQTLAKAKAMNDSESEKDADSGSDSGPEEIGVTSMLRSKGKEREKQEISKRKNKHAPMETTSKRPVPRKKVEIEEKRPVPRDPRFLPLVGEFSAQKFKSHYGFLADLHTGELATLRENLKRAKKLVVNSPRDQREERAQEVQRLERAVKRTESIVNQDKREKVEQTALQKMAQEEREKRKQGKKAWFMKDADKRNLLVKAKYDALAASGGRRAVKKAMDKKQKRVSQKEKKTRPFDREHVGKSESYAKRLGGDSGGEPRPRKRQRVL